MSRAAGRNYADDAPARLNRRRKALAIVTWCEENGYDPVVITDRELRFEIDKKVGLRRRASEQTWADVARIYDERRDAAAVGKTWGSPTGEPAPDQARRVAP